MAKLKNGIFTILGSGKKVIDIKITNAFPIIAVDSKTVIFKNDNSIGSHDYQHLSLPPDLRIHLTSPTDHLFIEPDLAALNHSCHIRLFTYVSKIISECSPLSGVWEGGSVIVSPFEDDQYNINHTRIVMDFILSAQPMISVDLNDEADWFANTRRASDQDGSFFGPINYQGFQRRPKALHYFCFVRMGYVEFDDCGRDSSLLRIFEGAAEPSAQRP